MSDASQIKPVNLPPGAVYGNLQKFSKQVRLIVTLENKLSLSSNVYKFTYKLPDSDLPLGVGPGYHVRLHAKVASIKKPQGQEINRMYCPVSPLTQKGTFDLVVKIYRRYRDPKYPEGGLMSQHLEAMEIGDTIEIEGPVMGPHYPGSGEIQMVNFTPFKVNNIGFIVGGSGITPIISILRSIAENPYDKTNVSLLYANTTEADILFKDELNQISAKCPQIKINYIISKPESNWKGLSGYVTKDMITQSMPAPDKGVFMWVGGPPDMDNAVTKQLSELGYAKNRTMAGMYSYIFRLIFAAIFGFGK